VTSLVVRRLTFTIAGMRVHPLAVIAALATALAIAAAFLVATRQPADAATIALPPTRAAALIQATTGDAATQKRAVGDEAKLINASLPFAGGPVLSARPFEASGSDLDQRRALLCLTQAVYYEAGFEPVEGRRAVAQVVLNRMRHPAFPKSVCGVVYQRNSTPVCQFTFVCDGSLYRAPAASAWRQSEDVARAALAGYVEKSVGAATHYHADYVAPRWAPLLAKVAKLGQHIFYRWPGAWGQPGAFTGRYIGEPRDPLSMRPPVSIESPAARMAVAEGPVTDGTVLSRAPNDVGGLLDTSKGWSLNIPGPEDSTSSAARMIAEQQAKTAPAAPATDLAVVPAAGPAIASR
jgi:spore germination cell wall hydrolase CwlJ-like protein